MPCRPHDGCSFVWSSTPSCPLACKHIKKSILRFQRDLLALPYRRNVQDRIMSKEHDARGYKRAQEIVFAIANLAGCAILMGLFSRHRVACDRVCCLLIADQWWSVSGLKTDLLLKRRHFGTITLLCRKDKVTKGAQAREISCSE